MKQNPYDKAKTKKPLEDEILDDMLGQTTVDEEVENVVYSAKSPINPEVFDKCNSCDEKKVAEDFKLRTLAEMDNFKKRIQREQEDYRKYAIENVLADILPSLDNFDLALQYGSKNEACKDILIGVEMTKKLLLDALKNHGLEVIGSVGEVFNPEVHEALGYDESTEMPADHVREVLQKGYKLKDRLLRPSKVMVSKSGTPRLNVKV